MKYDCGFKSGKSWFRCRAAAIIIENGCVLMAHNNFDDYYYSVGGAVKTGETSVEAVKREILEETGKDYEVERLAFVHENFFRGTGSLEGCNCHEVALYYVMKPQGNQKIDKKYSSKENWEYMSWIPIDKIESYKLFPTFFKEKLLNMPKYVEYIITNQID